MQRPLKTDQPMSTPKHPPMNSDQPEQAASTGKPQTPVYDSPTTNSAQPVQASFTGQQPTTINDQSPIANNAQPVQASFTGQGRTTNNASHYDPDKINLLEYLRIIYKHRWMILVITMVAMAATIALSLREPRMYQASTSIVPPINSQQGGLASRLGSGIGSSLLQGMLNQGSPSDLYVGILNSRAVADALIDRFDLMKVYEEVKTRTDAWMTLKSSTSIKASREGIVHITVTDRDPNRAAAVCNAYVEELDVQNKRLSAGQATNTRVFLETRLNEIQSELSKTESSKAGRFG